MENRHEKSETKDLLMKASELSTSDDFTLKVMGRIEVYEEKKIKAFSYYRLSFILIAIAVVLSFYVISYFSTVSCQIIKTHCEIAQYIFAGILASLILVQINFLITRFNQSKHAIV